MWAAEARSTSYGASRSVEKPVGKTRRCGYPGTRVALRSSGEPSGPMFSAQHRPDVPSCEFCIFGLDDATTRSRVALTTRCRMVDDAAKSSDRNRRDHVLKKLSMQARHALQRTTPPKRPDNAVSQRFVCIHGVLESSRLHSCDNKTRHARKSPGGRLRVCARGFY